MHLVTFLDVGIQTCRKIAEEPLPANPALRRFPMSTVTIAAIAIVVVAIAGAFWVVMRTRNTKRLRSRFGPEYDHLVQREGGRGRAETELGHREKRVEKLHIRSLTPEESEHFAAAWWHQQSLFVDDPRAAVSQADTLVTEVMTARGYPTINFQTQVADI